MYHYFPSQKRRIFKNKNLIIFDFDGVLADSFDTFYPLVRDAMKSVGLSLTPDQYRDFFIGNVHQSFKDFIKDADKYSKFSKFRNSNYTKYYTDKKTKAKLFPEAISFLKEISKNYILTVASSGRENNIKNLLGENGVKNLFSLILADSATSKECVIKEILDKFGKKPETSVMITDTVGDIVTAKGSGLKTIAVTWGFHSAKLLQSAKPDFLANNFTMLYKQLKAF